MFSDEPDRFFRAHPVQMIEASQIHWARVPSQGAFTAQIEVNIEVTHGQLAQSAIYRLAITAAGEIGFCHCAPMPAHLENGNDVIGVLFRFQIEDQWGKTENAKCSRAKNSALKT